MTPLTCFKDVSKSAVVISDCQALLSKSLKEDLTKDRCYIKKTPKKAKLLKKNCISETVWQISRISLLFSHNEPCLIVLCVRLGVCVLFSVKGCAPVCVWCWRSVCGARLRQPPPQSLSLTATVNDVRRLCAGGRAIIHAVWAQLTTTQNTLPLQRESAHTHTACIHIEHRLARISERTHSLTEYIYTSSRSDLFETHGFVIFISFLQRR